MFKFTKSPLFGALLIAQLVSTSSYSGEIAGSKGIKIIYGKDDRKDLFEVTDPLKLALADSTVALFTDKAVSHSLFRGIQLKGGSFQQQKNVCSTEPFADQPAGAFCSGTLIAKNLVLTAGHCVDSDKQCRSTKIVFGFGITNKNSYPYRSVREEVYECARIITSQEGGDGSDYAVIELDRDVENHKPVKIAALEASNPAVGSNVLMIGHPFGLPTKVDAGGTVLKNDHRHYIVASTDSYSGSSGSGIFNPQTGEIIGILTNGEEVEFTFDYPRHCFISRVCGKNDCIGEKINRVSFLPAIIAPYAHF